MLRYSNLNFFSKWVDTLTRQQIQSLFPVPTMSNQCKHLRHPIIFSHRDITQAYNFILNKFKAKLTGIGRLKTFSCNQ